MPAIYCYYGCKVAGNRPLIFTAHSKWEVENLPWGWKAVGGYLLRRMDRSVGVASAVSDSIRSAFKTTAEQTVTIENGIDIQAFGEKRDVRGLRAGLGITERDSVIGIVGNLKKVKDHLFLLRGFARVAEKYENIKLLIIGQGFSGEPDNTESDLRLFIGNHRLAARVSFLGYRTDIPELLQVIDVFCLTSMREGLPISLIEAMASGLPVVGTRVEGIRDVIEHGKDGMLVESGDVESLADTLIQLLNDSPLRRRFGTAARRKAIEKYSLKRCVEQHEKLFSELA